MTDVHDKLQAWLTDNSRLEDTRGFTATDRGDKPVGWLEIAPCAVRVEVTEIDEIPLDLAGTVDHPEIVDWDDRVDWRARRVWIETDSNGRVWAWYIAASYPHMYSPRVCSYRRPGVCDRAVMGVVPGKSITHGICPACEAKIREEEAGFAVSPGEAMRQARNLMAEAFRRAGE